MKRHITLLAVAALAIAACQSTEEPTDRKIMVPNDAAISFAVDVDGLVDLKVTIPAGSPFAGTYRSTSKYLLDDFMDAQTNQGKPGAAIWITVDEKDEIVSMTNQTTMQ